MKELELLGTPGSPYTRKMLALLRYRRIPYRIMWGSHFDPPADYPSPKVKLLPTFYFGEGEDKEAIVDSTPIIQRLERLYSERSVVPIDPVMRFIDLLIEDFADEWLTKAMFHYRWHYAEDAAHAGPLLAYWQNLQLNSEQAEKSSQAFAQRQISRLYVVGSSELTAGVIESSFQRLVSIMDRIIERHGFLWGSRPAGSDFAVYGQLTQLALVDPTSAKLVAGSSLRLRAWTDRMEDLSGHVAGQWLSASEVKGHLGELLNEIGRVYAPFLVANAKAVVHKQSEFETFIDGQRWSQPVFPYQAKCLEVLRQERSMLPKEVQLSLDELLKGTGCEKLFER